VSSSHKRERQQGEGRRGRDIGIQDEELPRQQAGPRHCREIPRGRAVVDHVAKEPVRMARGARDRQGAEHKVEAEIQVEEGTGQRTQPQVLRGKRNNARCHHHAKIRWG
jgi:hypothetical protein